ncbi:MAG: hypothetical protein KGD63_01690 [Candidatus Lokiarchaeota archaeon]|nr:hypothetical protein [Candidatus Lokiarchaeota archaeon]
MTQNKVKKYFTFIEIWAWCDICKEMIDLKVDKDEIAKGISMGIYTKEYKHTNPSPDPNDLDDSSINEHTIYAYINDQYNITEVKSFFGASPSLPELREGIESGDVRIPIIVKDVPKMSVDLGMVTAEEYKIMKICDGMNTIEKVAQIASNSVENTEIIMEKLRKKGLIKIIKRT